MPGKSVCFYHGGTGGRPPGGTWSASWGKLGQIYLDHLHDPELTSTERPLALLSVMIDKLGERAASCDTPEFRSRTLALINDVDNATDAAEELDAKRRLRDHVEKGVEEDAIFEKMRRVIEDQRRSLETHWKTHLERSRAVNEKDMQGILYTLALLIIEEVDEENADKILSRITRELMGAGHRTNRRALTDENGRGSVR